MTVSVVIHIHNLTCRYRRGTGAAALEAVSFSVFPHEIFGLLGPNGSGKTTLFRVLATLMAPGSGQVEILGKSIVSAPHEVRRYLGVVFQTHSLDRKLTVMENLKCQGGLYGLSGKSLQERSSLLLSQFELESRASCLVETLSEGLKRRVELAKALLHQPCLLLLDEPSSGLDPVARSQYWSYLEKLRQQEGVTILLATHLLDEAEKCDRLGILNRGRLVALDTPERLKGQVGGDVIVLQAREPESLRLGIEKAFECTATLLDNRIRIERPNGHGMITALMEAFPGRIDAITVSRPTLEDAFIHYTGQLFT
jgi:ABC-2 type transport system ATP-binding protein